MVVQKSGHYYIPTSNWVPERILYTSLKFLTAILILNDPLIFHRCATICISELTLYINLLACSLWFCTITMILLMCSCRWEWLNYTKHMIISKNHIINSWIYNLFGVGIWNFFSIVWVEPEDNKGTRWLLESLVGA
jgi:hypothetical protein